MLLDETTGSFLTVVQEKDGYRITLATGEYDNIFQQWAVMPSSFAEIYGERFTIRHPSSSRFLDVRYSECENGSRVHLWERNGTGAQTWVFGEGGFILNPMSGKCLNAGGYDRGPGKETIQIWEKPLNGDYKSQTWELTKDGMIIHSATGKALTGSSDGAVCLKPFDHGDRDQQWMLIPLSLAV
jgi:hypothetical protein